MSTPNAPESFLTLLQQLVETYTPDGAVGRLLFGGLTGSVGAFALYVALGFLLFTGTTVGTLLVVPLAALLGSVFGALSLTVLWPVYLSAIGRVESPQQYSRKLRERANGARPPRPSESESATPNESSAAERLQSAYLQGAISEATFERELEKLLADSDSTEGADDPDSRAGDDLEERSVDVGERSVDVEDAR